MSLLERVLFRVDLDPSLVGDLIEQRNAGRSRRWFWRQMLIAIVAGMARAAWAHKLLALRAMSVGIVTVALLRKAMWLPMQASSRGLGISVGNSLLEGHHDTARWIFMHYHLFDLPFVVASCLIYATAGWTIARTHRQLGAHMVLLFAVVTQLWWTWELVDQVRAAMLVPKMNIYPYMEALAFFLIAPCMLLAGLRADTRRSAAR
jgi:hypothetical protein